MPPSLSSRPRLHPDAEAVIQPRVATSLPPIKRDGALRTQVRLVLADIDMKPMDGITLLKQLKLYDPNVVVIIMTASIDRVRAAYTAFDYLQKPFRRQLLATLRRAWFRKFQEERAAGLAPGQAAEIEAGSWHECPIHQADCAVKLATACSRCCSSARAAPQGGRGDISQHGGRRSRAGADRLCVGSGGFRRPAGQQRREVPG